MSFDPLQASFFRALQKLLFFRRISTVYSETDIHAASRALLWDYLIYLWVGVKDVVDYLRFLAGNVRLAGDFAGAIGGKESAHYFSGSPDAEDGEGVVE